MLTAFCRITPRQFYWCAVFIAGWAANPCRAERVPLLIGQLRSSQEAFADFNFLTEAIGLGQLGQIFSVTTQQYTRGIDGTRPITLFIDGEADGYRWLLILPTTDMPTFVRSLGKAAESSRQLSNGAVEITGKRRFALQQRGSWTLVAESAESLALPTSIDVDQLTSPAGRADLSIAVFPGHLPSELQQRVYKAIQAQTLKQLRGVEGNGARAVLRQALTRELWDQLGQLVHDLEQLRVELNTDGMARKVGLQIDVTATSNSLTFRRLSQFQSRPSPVAGVLNSKATATWNATGTLPPEDAPRFENFLRLAAEAARDELQHTERFQDESTRRVATILLEGLFDAGQHSLRDGRFDGAGVLLTEGQELQGVSGFYLANPASIRQSLVAIAAESHASDRTWQLSSDFSQRPDVSLHRLTMATPADRAMLNAFGPQMIMWVGVADRQIWLALGGEGARLIELALQQASQADPPAVLPCHAQVMTGSAVRCYQHVSGDSRAARWLDTVAEQDRLLIRAAPLKQGVRFSIAADEGVLHAVGLALVPSFGRAEKSKP